MLANFSNLITFSRGSNATVTDASGRLTYAPHNLVTNSQDFEAAAWVKLNGGTGSLPVVTANSAVAPDGSTTADTIVFTQGASQTVNDFSLIRQSGFSLSGIASVYLRANSPTTVKISADDVTYTVCNVTTQWQRFFVYAATATRLSFGLRDSGTGTSATVFAWGAQLEAVTYQTTPSPYVSTSVANLLGFSEDFTNAAWTKLNAAIVPNVAQNPINNLWNAQKLMESTSAGVHYASEAVSGTTVGTVYTASVYVKPSGRDWIALEMNGALTYASFNVATGTVGTTFGSPTTSITPVGGGWYRCSITKQIGVAIAAIRVYTTTLNDNTFYTGDGNSGVYIYGAQLSNSGSLDPYVPTPGAAPSSTAYYGPRFDYDPVTLAAKGILIEEQRTNLLVRSEEFNNASWTANTSTVSPNVAISPDGTQDADRWVSDPGSTTHYLGQSYTSSASISYTFSVWVKSATGSNQTFRIFVQSSFASGDLTASTSWQRFTITLPSSTAGSFVAGLTRNGSNDPVDLLVYGAQLEVGAFATSYIPTVASQVTRTADVASITGSLFSQWYRQDEGTFVAEGSLQGQYPHLINARTDSSNSIEIYAQSVGANRSGNVDVKNGGVVQSSTQTASSSTTPFKLATVYKPNDFATVFNGGSVVTDTSGSVPTVNVLHIGSRYGTEYFGNGHIRTITYYPTRLTNDQLQAITK